MDGRTVSDAESRAQGRRAGEKKRGARITARGGYWHITGTVRIAGRSIRLRSTTGLDATAANLGPAEEILQRKIEALRTEIIDGRKPPITWPQAAVGYLDRRARQRAAKGIEGEDPEAVFIKAFTLFLKGRGLHLEPAESIAGETIHDFLKERHFDKGHAGVTASRTWDPVRAAFNEAVRLKRATGIPDFEIGDYIDERPANMPVIGKWLYPEEIALHVQCAPRHARPLLATLWNTGRRSGELVWVSRRAPDYNDANSTGLNMEPGREHLYLGRTKNGKPVFVWLNDAAVAAIAEWLAGREDEHDELFLTDKLVPYRRPKKKRGGIFRKAFTAASEAAATIIENEWKLPDRAAVMRQITPHWTRHNMTSHRMAAEESEDQIKKDMGWSSVAMVQRYGWDLPGKGKQRANIVQFDTKLTHDTPDTQNNDDKSTA